MKKKNNSQIMPPASNHGDLYLSFVKSALANPNLMIGVKTPSEITRRAMQIADEMMCALKMPQIPHIEKISKKELQRWENSLAKKKEDIPIIDLTDDDKDYGDSKRRQRTTKPMKFDDDIISCDSTYRHIYVYSKNKK